MAVDAVRGALRPHGLGALVEVELEGLQADTGEGDTATVLGAWVALYNYRVRGALRSFL